MQLYFPLFSNRLIVIDYQVFKIRHSKLIQVKCVIFTFLHTVFMLLLCLR